MIDPVQAWEDLKDNLPGDHAKAAELLFDAGDRLADEVEQLRKAKGWQPIEMAPKDGTRVLVWADGDWHFAAYYAPTRRWATGALSPSLNATHWMPKNPPKEADNGDR